MPATILPLIVGAAAGAVVRHSVTAGAAPLAGLMRVCAINTAGSFVLGATQSAHKLGRARKVVAIGVGTGFCGALTTFSTFAVQVADLLGEGPRKGAGCAAAAAAAYVAVSVALGVLAVVCGRAVGARLSS